MLLIDKMTAAISAMGDDTTFAVPLAGLSILTTIFTLGAGLATMEWSNGKRTPAGKH